MNFEEAVKKIDQRILEKTTLLSSVDIDASNFHELPLFASSEKITAIDGGNAPLIISPELCVEAVRICALSYKENKKTSTIKKEFLCIVSRSETYEIETVGAMQIKAEFPVEEDIEAIPGKIRRYAELLVAKGMEGSIIMDGSMEEDNPELLRELLTKKICFLSKTSSVTNKGVSMHAALLEAGPKSTWYYPLKEQGFGESFLVRLHPKSSHLFRLELPKGVKPDDVIASLAISSADPVFPGYPYPLIEADRMARISDREKEYFATLLMSKLKNKERLRHLLSASDAHSILDRMSF